MGVRPEDILADDESSREFNGVAVRKGTIKASIDNVGIIESAAATDAQKQQAREALLSLIPGVYALGLMDVMQWKNPEIQQLFDEWAEQNC
jgi:hypothetical protein